MARKQDTRTVKAAGKRPKASDAKPGPKTAAKGAAKTRAAKPKVPKKTLPEVRKAAPSTVRSAVSATTSAPVGAKKALRSARAQAKALLADLPLPAPVGAGVQAVGNQIVSWMSSDLGRVMLAELLVYVARQLAEAKTGTKAAAAGTVETVAGAGAKIASVAAEAGASALRSRPQETKADAPPATASNAGEQLVRGVTQAALGAVGELVAGMASDALSRKSGRKGKGSRKRKSD